MDISSTSKTSAALGPMPPPGPPQRHEAGEGTFAEIWQPPYDRRAILMSVFNFFQTFGYYGFAAWVPTLLIAKGINVTTSLEYAFIIAVANPVGPLLGTLIADRVERKWQICLGALGIGVFGMLFANSELPAALILLGVLVTLCNNLMSFSFHSYQSELFPTRIRSRAIGFVYSWSRLSAALSGLVVAYLLGIGGVIAVFSFIAIAMVIVVISIGGFGPRRRYAANSCGHVSCACLGTGPVESDTGGSSVNRGVTRSLIETGSSRKSATRPGLSW